MSLEIASPPAAPAARTAVIAGALALAALVAVQAFVIRPAFEASRSGSGDAVAAVVAEAADGVSDAVAPAAAAEPAPRDAGDAAVEAPAVEAPAAGAPAAGAPAVDQAVGQGLLAELPALTFVAGSSELTAESAAVLDALATKINQAPPGTSFEIRTHTDSQGDDAYNQWLSEQRAMVVCDGLVHVGVDQERLSIEGVGETEPLVTPEVTEADRQANRRVEVVPVAS